MAFGQDFLKTFFGNDYLKDYSHASKTFRTNGYENSPRFKFLFHVYFTINPNIPSLASLYSQDTRRIGLLVKNIDLPKYNLDVEVMNQYNRKRLVQKKINYEPVKVTFHDDGGDLIRTMWYNYFSYYYKDPGQKYRGVPNTNGTDGVSNAMANGFDYNRRDIYAANREVNDWGYIGESYNDGVTETGKLPFFQDIRVYGFNQHKFVEYVLINPMITDWTHDNYDYSQGDGIMENAMTIRYETVKYYSGAIGKARPDTYAKGFAAPENYDLVQSPLSRPGGTQSILGQGGLLDVGLGIYSDLSAGGVAGLIGAVQKAGTAYNTYKGKDLRAIAKEEVIAGAREVLRNDIPAAVRAQPNGSTSIQQRLQAPIFPTPNRNR